MRILGARNHCWASPGASPICSPGADPGVQAGINLAGCSLEPAGRDVRPCRRPISHLDLQFLSHFSPQSRSVVPNHLTVSITTFTNNSAEKTHIWHTLVVPPPTPPSQLIATLWRLWRITVAVATFGSYDRLCVSQPCSLLSAVLPWKNIVTCSWGVEEVRLGLLGGSSSPAKAWLTQTWPTQCHIMVWFSESFGMGEVFREPLRVLNENSDKQRKL